VGLRFVDYDFSTCIDTADVSAALRVLRLRVVVLYRLTERLDASSISTGVSELHRNLPGFVVAVVASISYNEIIIY
jgi:hypothetical protein